MANDRTLHEHLSRLVGTWRSEGRFTGGEHAGKTWGGFDIYEWFAGETHLVHRVDVEILGQRKEALEVFTPRDDASLSFDQISFDADGSVERAVGRFDDAGCYLNDAGAARATVTFHDAGSMSARWEQRGEDGAWSGWMDVTFTRVGDPHIEVRSRRDHAAAVPSDAAPS